METVILNIPRFPRDVRPIRATYQLIDEPSAVANCWATFRRLFTCAIHARWVVGFLVVIAVIISAFVAMAYGYFKLGLLLFLTVPMGIVAIFIILCCKPECRRICCCCRETASESLPVPEEIIPLPLPTDEWSPVSSFDPMLSVERSLPRPRSTEAPEISQIQRTKSSTPSEPPSVDESPLPTRKPSAILQPPNIEATLLPESLAKPFHVDVEQVAEPLSVDESQLTTGEIPTLPEPPNEQKSLLPTIELPGILQASTEEVPMIPESPIDETTLLTEELRAIEQPPSVRVPTLPDQQNIDESPLSEASREGSMTADEAQVAEMLNVDESPFPTGETLLIPEPPFVNYSSPPKQSNLEDSLIKEPVAEPPSVDESPLSSRKELVIPQPTSDEAQTLTKPPSVDESSLSKQSRVESSLNEAPVAEPLIVDKPPLPTGEPPNLSREDVSLLPTEETLAIPPPPGQELQTFPESQSDVESPLSTSRALAVPHPPLGEAKTLPEQQSIDDSLPKPPHLEGSLTVDEAGVSLNVNGSPLPTGEASNILEPLNEHESSLPSIGAPVIIGPPSDELQMFPEPPSCCATSVSTSPEPPSVTVPTFPDPQNIHESPVLEPSHEKGSLSEDDIESLSENDFTLSPENALALFRLANEECSDPSNGEGLAFLQMRLVDLPLSKPSDLERPLTVDESPLKTEEAPAIPQPQNKELPTFPETTKGESLLSTRKELAIPQTPSVEAPAILESPSVDESPLPKPSRVEETLIVEEAPVAEQLGVEEEPFENL